MGDGEGQRLRAHTFQLLDNPDQLISRVFSSDLGLKEWPHTTGDQLVSGPH